MPTDRTRRPPLEFHDDAIEAIRAGVEAERIARHMLGITRFDATTGYEKVYCELGIWEIKAALVSAYLSGRRSARGKS